MIGASKKLLQATAGNAGGDSLNVEDVFSTYLYEGNSSTQTITNDIDLAGGGGLVWLKGRSTVSGQGVYDTERGVQHIIQTNSTSADYSPFSGLTSFNSNGFTIGSQDNNGSGSSNVSWTFRKTPKFFDVVTWTGDGVIGRAISHNLGSVPGTIIVKCTNASVGWYVYHRSLGNSSYMRLDGTDSVQTGNGIWNNTDPTSTQFYVSNQTSVNSGDYEYVAYVFAHNDGDSEFGPAGDQDIIKCGGYAGNGSSNGPEIDLGFEPQWVLIKRYTASSNWELLDSMRGFTNKNFGDGELNPQATNSENTDNRVNRQSTGFQPNTNTNDYNASGHNYIYIAIRRGPSTVPEVGTEVFNPQTYTGNGSSNRKMTTGFLTDANITFRRDGGSPCLGSRMYNAMQQLNANNSSYSDLYDWIDWDYNEGYEYAGSYSFSNTNGSPYLSYSWKRAPGYFDVLAYTGNGSSNTETHNLAATPEMIWFKSRNTSGADDWYVYHKDAGTSAYLTINTGDGKTTRSSWISVSDTEFTVDALVSQGSTDYITYLFSSCSGVSKVGSYVGTGATQSIDCGFTSGARFVMVKRRDNSSTGWGVVDSARGLTASADPYMFFNLSTAEGTSNILEPLSSGFKVVATGSDWNFSGETYIFYAIA